MSTIKKFAGETAIYGLSTVISRTLNFFLTPILAEALPAKVYGIFTKMYSYASILNAVIAFGMETTFFRYLNKHPDNKSKIYNNSFLAIAGMALIFFLATIFSSLLARESGQAKAEGSRAFLNFVTRTRPACPALHSRARGATIPTTDPTVRHAVMIIGWNWDGTYEYFDSALGGYAHLPAVQFNNIEKITGIKVNP